MMSPSVRSLPDRVSFVDARAGGVHLSFRRGADMTVNRERLVTIQDSRGEQQMILAAQLLEDDIVLHVH